MADVQNSAPGGESKNVFTELFGKDTSQKDSGLMSTVAQQQEKKGGGFFDSKPKMDEVAKIKASAKHASQPGATFLKASVLLLALTVAGFLSQNVSMFSYLGTNPALRVEQAAQQLSDEIQRGQLAVATRDVGVDEARQLLEAEIQRGTLADQLDRTDLQRRQTDVAELNSAMERAIAQGNITGDFTDPVTLNSYQTLVAQQQTWQQTFNTKQQDIEKRLAEAEALRIRARRDAREAKQPKRRKGKEPDVEVKR